MQGDPRLARERIEDCRLDRAPRRPRGPDRLLQRSRDGPPPPRVRPLDRPPRRLDRRKRPGLRLSVEGGKGRRLAAPANPARELDAHDYVPRHVLRTAGDAEGPP